MYVNKARLFIPFLQLVGDPQRLAHDHGCFVQFLPELMEGVCALVHGAVVAQHARIELLRLHPPTRLQVFVGALDDCAKILKGAHHHTGMDVVVRPAAPVIVVGVVDQPFNVG